MGTSAPQTKKGILEKLKLNSHYEMERFGIAFTSLVVLFALVVGMSGFSAYENNQADLTSTQLYANTFTTSRTQLTGEVTGVYNSEDNKRSMVMMKFDDPQSVSSDANKYQVFLTGSNVNLGRTRIENEIRGRVVVFGTTGYMGVILDAAKAFEPQVLNMVVRATDELVYNSGDPAIPEDMMSDTSFAENDQWRIYFNPGASGIKTIKELGPDKFEAGKIFASTVSSIEEAEIREKMYDQLGIMRADLARIESYEDELGRTSTTDGDFLVPVRTENPQPALKSIAGDEIVNRKTGEPAEANEKLEDLELKTEWTSPNGFNFNWQDASVYDSYLDLVVPTDEKYGAYLTEKAQAENTEGYNSSDVEWKLTDGSSYETTTIEKSILAPLTTVKTSLDTAYQTYYRNKIEYQEALPRKLLELEVALRNVETTYSMNDADNALLTY